MSQSFTRYLTGLLFAVLLVSCATDKPVLVAPDTAPGDQIMAKYLVNEWCTNREETATINQQAGHSGLLNVRPLYWRFAEDGQWDVSDSGFIFEPHGRWKVEGLDSLVLEPEGQPAISYDANFKSADLYLVDAEKQYLVLSHCD